MRAFILAMINSMSLGSFGFVLILAVGPCSEIKIRPVWRPHRHDAALEEDDRAWEANLRGRAVAANLVIKKAHRMKHHCGGSRQQVQVIHPGVDVVKLPLDHGLGSGCRLGDNHRLGSSCRLWLGILFQGHIFTHSLVVPFSISTGVPVSDPNRRRIARYRDALNPGCLLLNVDARPAWLAGLHVGFGEGLWLHRHRVGRAKMVENAQLDARPCHGADFVGQPRAVVDKARLGLGDPRVSPLVACCRAPLAQGDGLSALCRKDNARCVLVLLVGLLLLLAEETGPQRQQQPVLLLGADTLGMAAAEELVNLVVLPSLAIGMHLHGTVCIPSGSLSVGATASRFR